MLSGNFITSNDTQFSKALLPIDTTFIPSICTGTVTLLALPVYPVIVTSEFETV